MGLWDSVTAFFCVREICGLRDFSPRSSAFCVIFGPRVNVGVLVYHPLLVFRSSWLLAGCVVLGTAGTPEGLKLISEEGADHAYNHRLVSTNKSFCWFFFLPVCFSTMSPPAWVRTSTSAWSSRSTFPFFVFDSEPKHMKHIMKATGGRGVDVIIEMFADLNLGHDLEILAPKARVVVSILSCPSCAC
jgi:hypothetical protein